MLTDYCDTAVGTDADDHGKDYNGRGRASHTN